MPRLLPRRARERAPQTAISQLHMLEREYANGSERPLGSYAGLLGTYTGLVSGLVAVGRARGASIPDRIPAADLALLAVATFRASRLLTKDSVTAVARAPFTRFEEAGGPGEVEETVVGTGPRHAVGELLSCPFCISVWVASVGIFGLIVFPRQTRLACSLLGAVAASDVLQFAYSAMHEATG
jgi:hypothetical protein